VIIYPNKKSNNAIVIFYNKKEKYFCLVLRVLLIIGSIVVFKYKKTHLTNKKDYPVKTTLICV